MKELFEQYLLELRKAYAEDGTEHSGRPALQNFLDAVAAELAPKAHVQHEPKRQKDKGAPDYKVSQSGMILGYVETKPIDIDLNKVRKSKQIKKYRELTGNLLLTDYLHFIWIKGDTIQRESIAYSTDLANPTFVPRADRVQSVSKILEGFFSTPPEGIGRAQKLALALAVRSQFLRDFLDEELVRQERDERGGRLYGLFQIFRDQVFHELKVTEFADAFAQMLAYGLFLAKLNAGDKLVDLHNVKQFIPGSFRLIRELADFLDVLENDPYRDIRWVVEEILSITNGLNLVAIHEDLSFRHRKVRRGVKAKSEDEARLFERDPFVYFYEDYLSRYDPKLRETRGVYYTPPPVVNFIIRAIDDILRDDELFGIKEGLADHNRVTVLDFACGTGTFLVEVFERIFENIGGMDVGKAGLVVREHMLKNIYGFEYLIAPYTVAHLKLSQYLEDRGHKLRDGERLQVFLTNTLEPIEPQRHMLLPELTREIEAAQEVKEQPILVITGNPPYSGHSRNKGPIARKSIDAYKVVDDRPLGEKNPKWLQDDYVKFIRFAQQKMDGFTYEFKAPDGKLIEHSVEGVEHGVVGIITNHSYLKNPTFRGMRQSLMQTFDQIFILDLHGSTKPKETPPDGQVDQNVFEIQKGVAIALFVKRPDSPRGVWYAELWGRQLAKYEMLVSQEFRNHDWTELEPVSPFYLFIPQDRDLWSEYEKGWPIPRMFTVSVLGFQTHRDHFAIARSRQDIESRVSDLRNKEMGDQQLREKYALKDNRDWQLARAREALGRSGADDEQIIKCAYRPFDQRWCWFGYEFMDYPRRELIEHVAERENLQILVSRQVGTNDWCHVLVVDTVAESCVVSNQTKAQNYNCPLYLYPSDKIENFSPNFRTFIDARYEYHYSCEEIYGYIYAVLFAPSFRKKYDEFLSIDFPRVPFPEISADLEALSALGWDLMQKHLLRGVPNEGLGKYQGKGDHEVERPRFAETGQAIYINDTQKFAPVPLEVWEFHIGGYQVLSKYLKDRKGRTLSLDEINNIENITNVLAFTIKQMAAIDKAYLKAFPDRG